MAKEVLVLFKTHLDIGFTDFAENVIDKYLNVSIPKAIKVGYELKGTSTPFIWTLGSWMVWEALKNDKDGFVDRAIKDGILTWHGLPFTTHTELMNKELFEYGLSISDKLDKRYNRKTEASKMTDVPGHTIGMVSLMAKHGIKFMHIGVNPATPLPEVPQIFKWKNGKDSIIVMYEKDYGLTEEFDDFVLCFAHTGDNLGPQSADEVINVYKDLMEKYPGYEIKAATLDDLYHRVVSMEDMPVIDKEIGDTWIHGAGTDPKKVSGYRQLLRYLENHDVSDVDLTDSLLLVPEHTWGRDIKLYFHNDKDYTYNEMDALKGTTARDDMEKSWEEQREYVRKAQRQLKLTEDYDTTEPDLSEYEEIETVKQPDFEISWQLFDRNDYNIYKETYNRIFLEWVKWDFTKPGLPDYQGGIYTAKVLKCFKKGKETLYRLEFDSGTAEKIGLPYFYVSTVDNLVTVKWFSKKASRLPQACWLKFKGYDEEWRVNKMSEWIDPKEIIGSPLITAVDKGIKNNDVIIYPVDSCLVAPFGRNLLRYNLDEKKKDMYFNLYNNIWNTNFPMWYEDDAVFRFKIDIIVEE